MAETNNQQTQKPTKGYGKRPLWQWILLYIVIGGIIYFLIYLIFIHHGSGSSSY